jgi:dipeptidyl aminopeptidase/acylaminoacyl peptidase
VFSDVRSDGRDRVFLIGGSWSTASEVAELNNRVLKRSAKIGLEEVDFSRPEPIAFPTAGGKIAFALFYQPANSKFTGPADQRPPLLVISHGGPTSATSSRLNLGLQFWTSRGFAVVDVNYGGSTGYGRKYRERLNGQWGIVDVQDCIAAVQYLAQRGDVDANRVAIRGHSAGGYTTLCALVGSKVFAAGASHFGVADLRALMVDSHKFEARYLDRLIGPYPEAAEVYRRRSPVNHADQLSCPVILFQGLEDKVVPPSQAEIFVAALRKKGLPFAYVSFAGEGHGFRKAQTIQRVVEAELYFYSRVFGFKAAGDIAAVEIENLP